MTAPLMAQLADVRRQRGIPATWIAARLGRHPASVTRLELLRDTPRYVLAVAYAEALDCQVVLCDGDKVVAAGWDVPSSLRALRRASGLTQNELAPLAGTRQPALSKLESCGNAPVSLVEAYASALGMRLTCEPNEVTREVRGLAGENPKPPLHGRPRIETTGRAT